MGETAGTDRKPVNGKAHRGVPTGRRPGKANGALRQEILYIVKDEAIEAPLSDDAMAAQLKVSQPAITKARNAAGIPASRDRASLYVAGYALGPSLARCSGCMAWYALPTGFATMACPRGHGKIHLGQVRLIPR